MWGHARRHGEALAAAADLAEAADVADSAAAAPDAAVRAGAGGDTPFDRELTTPRKKSRMGPRTLKGHS